MTSYLIGGHFPPTTREAAVFDAPQARVIQWFLEPTAWDGDIWKTRRLRARNLQSAVEALLPLTSLEIRRYIFVPIKGWTLMFNNSNLGTDAGVLPSLAARQLACRALRIVDHRRPPYPAVMLELYDPNHDGNPLKLRRQIYAANDGGRWRFVEDGLRFPFEEVAAYERNRIRDRFTIEMQRDYLRHLGVPELTEENADFSNTILAERKTPTLPGTTESGFETNRTPVSDPSSGGLLG